MSFLYPILNARLTSKYGYRTHPVTGKKNVMHKGVDFARTPNTNVPILATADGVVKRVAVIGTYGNVIIIQHKVNGKIMESLYAHLKNGSELVRKGDIVKQGQKIATMGNTGGSSGPHLHFEIHEGVWKSGQPNAVDPMKYLTKKTMEVTNTNEEDEEEMKEELAKLKAEQLKMQKEITALKSELKEKADLTDHSHSSTWAKEAVDWALSKGILKGEKEGKYKYNLHGSVTMERMLVILYRLFK